MKKNTVLKLILLLVVNVTFADNYSMDTSSVVNEQKSEKNAKNLQGGVVTVGDQNDCDFQLGESRIQSAINSGAAIIRLAESTYNENLIINDRSIIITGGFSTCSDAASNHSNGLRQVLDGTFVAPVFTITSHQQRQEVTLENLHLKQGQAAQSIPGGGVNTIEANLTLNLNNVWITDSIGLSGGGLNVMFGDTDVMITDSVISHNTAENGGGIRCAGPLASVLINESNINQNSGIFFNEAINGDGGGVHLSGGCIFTSYSGSKDYTKGKHQGIHNNMATGSGGGIAVIDSGYAFLNGHKACFNGSHCLGNNTDPINVEANLADSDNDGQGFGGGVYATGGNAHVNLSNAVIARNQAQSGGGMAIENQAILTMKTEFFGGHCWDSLYCSQVIENKTATNNTPIRGGGIYTTSGSRGYISRTIFARNNADFGTAIYAFKDNEYPVDTYLDLEGVLIVNNGSNGSDLWRDSDTVRNNNAYMKINFSTIADNDVANTSANIFNTGPIANLGLYNSIIHNNDGLPVFRGINHDNADFYECLLLNETGSLPADETLIADNPGFLDRKNGNYQLNPIASAAVDFCHEFNQSVTQNSDINGDERGVDEATVSNLFGPYDVGFDESNDQIFSNGFEN